MFPAPSPNTQALFNLQSGVQTPSTADFQQSALRAAAQANKFPPTSAPTTQPETSAAGMSQSTNSYSLPVSQPPRAQNDPFAAHEPSDAVAANDLLSFAKQGPTRAGNQSFAIPPQPTQINNPAHMPVQPVEQVNGRRNTKGSINSLPGSVDTADFSESGQSEQKTNTRSRSKKGPTTNGKQNAGSKRKADETPKTNSRKKATNGASMGSMGSMGSMDDSDDEDTSPKPEDGRKMTDEEKRKNFLERNRSVFPYL